MNDIKTLADVERVLTEHGYSPTLNEGSVTLPIGAEGSPFPCLILMDGTNLTVICEIDTWGNIMNRIPPAMREDFFFAQCHLNSQMNSFAFTVIPDMDGDGEDDDDRENCPVALINSMPIGDISEGELLESMRSLLAALQTASTLYSVSAVESL